MDNRAQLEQLARLCILTLLFKFVITVSEDLSRNSYARDSLCRKFTGDSCLESDGSGSVSLFWINLSGFTVSDNYLAQR